MSEEANSKAIALGHPSYVWRFGQDRRLDLIRRYADLDARRILDVGCGLGTYVKKLRAFSEDVYGVDIDAEKVAQAKQELEHIFLAPAEELPFPDAYFDVVLLHEVLEHVENDRRALREAYRVAKVGGRLVIFVPNRLYPFETHGVYWRGEYHFGNIPLVNYLPDAIRDRLCPHVRTYTRRSLLQLLDRLAYRLVVHRQIYPGYDNIAWSHPALARALRNVTYALENTPLRVFGLSHLLVAEKTRRP
ncbi:MAG: class I SAM-dependent methyltransferase [Anaerolineales bacterium]|nr:MAG: class I SAM-dependent methyltransferase [Anaerolineales bacterium]